MNMVRISVNPHQLESILNIISTFHLETVTVREVRELEPGFARSVIDQRGRLTQPKAQLEMFVPEPLTEQLLTVIRKAASIYRPAEAEAILLNCENYQPVKVRS